jgi:hypothetical protein
VVAFPQNQVTRLFTWSVQWLILGLLPPRDHEVDTNEGISVREKKKQEGVAQVGINGSFVMEESVTSHTELDCGGQTEAVNRRMPPVNRGHGTHRPRGFSQCGGGGGGREEKWNWREIEGSIDILYGGAGGEGLVS